MFPGKPAVNPLLPNRRDTQRFQLYTVLMGPASHEPWHPGHGGWSGLNAGLRICDVMMGQPRGTGTSSLGLLGVGSVKG